MNNSFSESAVDYFAKYKNDKSPFTQFRAEAMDDTEAVYVPQYRRDFYKITLITKGKILLRFGNDEILIDRPAVYFVNPLIPYAYQTISARQSGYFCLFTKDFFLTDESVPDCFLHSPLLDVNMFPVIFLEKEQVNLFSTIFKRMVNETAQFYRFQKDLLLSYTHILLHETIKISGEKYLNIDTNSRTAYQFIQLLESQFPILSKQENSVRLRKPKDFANEMFLHVNHLNFVLKQTLGKSTEEIISGRLVSESQKLLTKTNWTIEEIANVLGFFYPSYFVRFFKKHTGTTPLSYRQSNA